MTENEPIIQSFTQPQKKHLKHAYSVRPSSESDEGMPDDYRTAMRELNAKCWRLSREILARESK